MNRLDKDLIAHSRFMSAKKALENKWITKKEFKIRCKSAAELAAYAENHTLAEQIAEYAGIKAPKK